MIKIWEYIYHTSNHSNFHLPYNHAQLMQIFCVVFCLVCRQIILLRLSKLARDHLVCIGKRSHANNVVKADCQHVGCINISCLNLNAIKMESCNEYVCQYVSLIKKIEYVCPVCVNSIVIDQRKLLPPMFEWWQRGEGTVKLFN